MGAAAAVIVVLKRSAASKGMCRFQGPFTYEALAPADIVFTPLKQTREFSADELLQVRCISLCYFALLLPAESTFGSFL